jgi:hypothetical protein
VRILGIRTRARAHTRSNTIPSLQSTSNTFLLICKVSTYSVKNRISYGIEDILLNVTFAMEYISEKIRRDCAQTTNVLVLQNIITSHHCSIASITFTRIIFKSFESDVFTLQVETLFIGGNVLFAE